MEPIQGDRPKIRAVPAQNSALLLIPAALFVVFGVFVLICRATFVEAKFVGILFPLRPALCALATGLLLALCVKRPGLFFTAGCVLTVTLFGSSLLAALAALLLLLSCAGLRANRSVLVLSRSFPVFNLAAAAAALLAILTGFGSLADDYAHKLDVLPAQGFLFALLASLPCIAVVILSLCTRAETVEGGAATKSAVPPKSPWLQAAVWVLLAYGALGLLDALVLRESFYLGYLLATAAGVLLLQANSHEKRYLAAVILFGVHAVVSPYSHWMLLPVLMMIVSYIGASWNAPQDFKGFCPPALNLAAAALLLVTAAEALLAIPAQLSGEAPWLPPILNLLLPLSLGLLNLSLGSRAASRGAEDLTRFTGGHPLARLVRWIYGDVGGHLQMLAKIQGVILLCIAGLSALTAAVGMFGILAESAAGSPGGDFGQLLLLGGCGFVASALFILTTLPLYAFGQITSDVHAIRQGGADVPAPEAQNPDELPEL